MKFIVLATFEDGETQAFGTFASHDAAEKWLEPRKSPFVQNTILELKAPQ